MLRDPRGGHNRKSINQNFFKKWSPEMAYVLGFLFADGSLIDSNDSSRTYYLMFANNNLDLLKQIRSAMESTHRIYVKPAHIMKHKQKQYVSKQSYVLRIGNKNMYQDLISLGLSHRKSKSMMFPNIPDRYFFKFLRGYLDGDGCINTYLAKKRNYQRLSLIFSSGSVSFLSGLSLRLSCLVQIPQVNYCKSMGAFNLIYRGKNAILVLEMIYSNLKSAPYLEYKYNKYINFINNQIGPRLKLWLTSNN